VSNTICDDSLPDQPARSMAEPPSLLFMFFAQLLAHDIAHTPSLPGADSAEAMPIRVPAGDRHYDPDASAKPALLRMRRSIYRVMMVHDIEAAREVHAADHSQDSSSHGVQHSQREQLNKATSFLDASFLYGPTQQRASALRRGCRGELVAYPHPRSRRAMPPFNIPIAHSGVNLTGHRGETALENDNPLAAPVESLFVAGDPRSMENPALLGLHVVFLREHNQLARKIHTALCALHPDGGGPVDCAAQASSCDEAHDEEVYQLARSLVIAELQSVVINEFLPVLLGDVQLSTQRSGYAGYRADLSPSVLNEFATAAFRFGHSLAPSDIAVRPSPAHMGSHLEDLHLKDVFHLRGERFMGDSPALEGVLTGVAQQPSEPLDERINDALRNFLQGPGRMRPAREQTRGYGLDLASFNVQRGRDHGLADFNSVRSALGLARLDFDDGPWVASGCAERLRALYASADDIDLWIGGLCEQPTSSGAGLLGETFKTIVRAQFDALIEGDRFWHEAPLPHGLGNELAAAVRRATTFRSMLQRHGVTLSGVGREGDREAGEVSRDHDLARHSVFRLPAGIYKRLPQKKRSSSS